MASRFIVTGAAGFIGSNVAAALNARGHSDVVVVDHLNHPDKKRNLERLTYTEYFDRDEFRARFRENRQEPVDAVFHLGACSATTETNEAYMLDNNLAYTRELCEWCLANGARFVYASSAATYGDGARGYSDQHAGIPALEPLNLYGRSKQLFDLWALENGVLDRIVGLKFFNVFGPGEDHKGFMRSVINKAYTEILETGELKLFKSHRPDYGDGEQVRDFIYVKDAVKVTLFFWDHPEVSGVFNCGTGTPRSWLDLGRSVFAATGRDPVIQFVDMPESIRDKYQYHTQADLAKLRAAGYTEPFMSLEDAAQDYTNYLAKRQR